MMLADVWRGTRDAETSASYHTPLVMHHALSLSIIRGRGDVVTRFILLLSADAYAMQLCKQGLVADIDLPGRCAGCTALSSLPKADSRRHQDRHHWNFHF